MEVAGAAETASIRSGAFLVSEWAAIAARRGGGLGASGSTSWTGGIKPGDARRHPAWDDDASYKTTLVAGGTTRNLTGRVWAPWRNAGRRTLAGGPATGGAGRRDRGAPAFMVGAGFRRREAARRHGESWEIVEKLISASTLLQSDPWPPAARPAWPRPSPVAETRPARGRAGSRVQTFGLRSVMRNPGSLRQLTCVEILRWSVCGGGADSGRACGLGALRIDDSAVRGSGHPTLGGRWCGSTRISARDGPRSTPGDQGLPCPR